MRMPGTGNLARLSGMHVRKCPPVHRPHAASDFQETHMNGFANFVKPPMWLMALLLAAFVTGCGSGGEEGGAGPSAGSSSTDTVAPGPAGTAGAADSDPTVSSASPVNGATDITTSSSCNDNVVTGRKLTATFSQPMNPATINSSPAGTLRTFTLKETDTGIDVPGTVAMNADGTVATFTPTEALKPNTSYTAKITTAATSADGVPLAKTVKWTFTTKPVSSIGMEPVECQAAGSFVILAKAGVTNVPTSAITGNVGASPITGAAIGLSCPEVTGTIYSVDAAGPLPCAVVAPDLLTDAVIAAEAMYTDAAGRTSPEAITGLGAGEIGGQTLLPGLYNWTTGVLISTDVTLSGGPDAVWIFQVGEGITQASGTNVVLQGGALPENVFWQAAGIVAIGTDAHFEGVVLSQSDITLGTRASVNGRLFSEKSVTLDQNTVTESGPCFVQ
jgi:hypothetical protein